MLSLPNRFLCINHTKAFYALATVLIYAGFSSSLNAAITQVHLSTSPASPQLLGTTIQLTASASDSDPGPINYKWEVQTPGSSTFHVMRDFSVTNTFTWAPSYVEGTYQLRLTARDHRAGTSAQQVISFQVNPLVTGNLPVAVATAHPLVALLSAPTCPIGSTMAVAFKARSASTQSITDWRPCHAGTMNFYIGGMTANTTYILTYVVTTAGVQKKGPFVTFTSGSIPTDLPFPAMSVPVPPSSQTDTRSGLALSGYAAPPDIPTATDLNGNINWYYSKTLVLTRPLTGGTMLSIPSGQGTGTGVWGPAVTRQQLLREYDLVGNTLTETNCDRVYEQLTAMGLTDPLGSFNHDAIRLNNGLTMVIGDAQRIYPAGTQGSPTPLDIVGALIIILDANFQVVGYWNAFDHACAGPGCVDINRRGDFTCTPNGQGVTPGGCPPVLLSSPANDWIHVNSLQYLPTEGDLLLSLRNQDWIVKVDYQDGAGAGSILWKLGLGGDFTLVGGGSDPYPWFSGQHNPAFVGNEETTLLVYDNGTTRHSRQGSGNSRGQVYTIDEINMKATLNLNVDLGVYSPSLGSAQQMLNGDYMFFSGNIKIGTTIKVQNTETSTNGVVTYELQGTGPSPSYRGWRLTDFYHGPFNGSAGPQ